jgi:hypothetical protein
MAITAFPHPIFQRSMRIISSLSQANPVVVTTTFAHNYETGEIVRIVLPLGYGMQQINQQYTPIVVTGDTTFTMAIDSTHYDPFSVPSTQPQNLQYAQVVPMAELSGQLEGATRNVLPFNAV